MAKKRKSATDELTNLPQCPTIVPEVVEFFELTPEEQKERRRLERIVERSFVEAGRALRKLRSDRLYRSTHRTFEEYCRERFDFSRRRPYQLIKAAAVVEHLQTECEQFVHIWPTKEGQVRPLISLEPELQVEAWQQAVEQNGGKVPPARMVKDVVQRIRERHPLPNPYRVGDVCSILVLENPDLRGRGGCWALVTEVHQFSCTVRMWDGECQVRIENLKELPYSPAQREEVKKLCERLGFCRKIRYQQRNPTDNCLNLLITHEGWYLIFLLLPWGGFPSTVSKNQSGTSWPDWES